MTFFTRYGLLNGRVIDINRAALVEGHKPEATGDVRGVGKSDAAKASAPAYVARIALETTTMTIEGTRNMQLKPSQKISKDEARARVLAVVQQRRQQRELSKPKGAALRARQKRDLFCGVAIFYLVLFGALGGIVFERVLPHNRGLWIAAAWAVILGCAGLAAITVKYVYRADKKASTQENE